jgi:acyl-CoA thioester hydrolase
MMFTSTTSIRIHYALTDQMGVVYHGRYAEFFEIGRAEAIREFGYTYKDMEAMGIIMPVVELQVRYLRPVRYDETIFVKTELRSLPTDHKVTFHHEIRNEQDELVSTGFVTLYFMDAKTMQRTNMPASLYEKLQPYYASAS